MRESSCASVASSTGCPFHTMRSLTCSRCGLVYTPTDRPDASRSAAVMRATEVLPFVPVRWIAGYESCGDPSNSTSASMRSSVGAVARRSAPGGSPVDSRLTWASSQARAAPMSKSGRVFGEVDLDRELVGFEELQRAYAPRLPHVGERGLERVQALGGVPHDRQLDLGPQRLLPLRLRLANLAEHIGSNLVAGGRGVDDETAHAVQQRPVEGFRHLTAGTFPDDAERELRRVQDLDREPPADLHLPLVEGSVDAGPSALRPVADGVGAEPVEVLDRSD